MVRINRLIFYLVLSVIFLQCSNGQKKNNNQEPTQQKKYQQKFKEEDPIVSKGDYYFDFDEVTHYSLNDKSVIKQLMKKDLNNLSKEDQIIYDCYSEDYPKNLKDKSYLSTFDRMKYNKISVDTSTFSEINEIFREKKHRYTNETACIPEYNDILVFRKKKKIIGLAKVCFGCMMNHILGTTKNTSQFGQSGDYEKLKKILYN